MDRNNTLYPITYPRLVALFTRAWIEINLYSLVDGQTYVALFTRAWIEMN